MEDEERQRLIQKLDADLEAFIQEKAKKKQDADSLSEETVEETDIDALAEVDIHSESDTSTCIYLEPTTCNFHNYGCRMYQFSFMK